MAVRVVQWPLGANVRKNISFVSQCLGEDAIRIFESTTAQEHVKYMLSEFPRLKWNFLIFVVGNSSFSMRFSTAATSPKRIPKAVTEVSIRMHTIGFSQQDFLEKTSFFN